MIGTAGAAGQGVHLQPGTHWQYHVRQQGRRRQEQILTTDKIQAHPGFQGLFAVGEADQAVVAAEHQRPNGIGLPSSHGLKYRGNVGRREGLMGAGKHFVVLAQTLFSLDVTQMVLQQLRFV